MLKFTLSIRYRGGDMDVAVRLWHQGRAISLTKDFCLLFIFEK
ncbi:hypothetical protein HMP0015_1151 [Acinetobacter haemolyticus ATCC 19194]|uniref:Uncharacterized protein n=1 Tax=Acinetobacter haemolyticus ATCC 19194 TaxID=707232 RepID=D4XN59_ACIHA|nr:hypothetical protein HMP0015_1151 [Acinetobacter haemolyticus ATCC 19194]